MNAFSQLKKYVETDVEKAQLMHDLMANSIKLRSIDKNMDELSEKRLVKYAVADMDFCEDLSSRQLSKTCPKCGKSFDSDEIYCPKCLVALKRTGDGIKIRDIHTNPVFEYPGLTDSGNILTDENFALINNFDFTMADFRRIIRDIKAQAFRNLDELIKDNSIDLDSLEISDKVLLFAKSFVEVRYKSYGGDLGYFEFNRIYVDDRQRKSLQITTMIHELAHFLLKEILTHVTCNILKCAKNRHVEAVITYMLTHSTLNRLIDEYAAHSVEGRFTIFGYQDYSSFKSMEKELDAEHAEIAKTIGNTFAIHMKEILEAFLDWDLREEIKEQFLDDTIEEPDYRQLAYESCSRLSDDGFLKAIWLMLSEGFQDIDIEVVNEYAKEL